MAFDPAITTGTEPSAKFPVAKVIVPAGSALPVTAVTVAVSCVVPAGVRVAGLATRVSVVPTPWRWLVHFVTRFHASTEPRPVTRS